MYRMLLVLPFLALSVGAQALEFTSPVPEVAGAHLTVYPVAASDQDLVLTPYSCGQWRFTPTHKGAWIACGQGPLSIGGGWVIAQQFMAEEAAVELTPVYFPPAAMTEGETLASVGFNPPELPAGLVRRWELLEDGQPILAKPGKVYDSTAPRTHTYQLRGLLVGTPKAHYLSSETIEAGEAPGDQT